LAPASHWRGIFTVHRRRDSRSGCGTCECSKWTQTRRGPWAGQPISFLSGFLSDRFRDPDGRRTNPTYCLSRYPTPAVCHHPPFSRAARVGMDRHPHSWRGLWSVDTGHWTVTGVDLGGIPSSMAPPLSLPRPSSLLARCRLQVCNGGVAVSGQSPMQRRTHRIKEGVLSPETECLVSVPSGRALMGCPMLPSA